MRRGRRPPQNPDGSLRDADEIHENRGERAVDRHSLQPSPSAAGPARQHARPGRAQRDFGQRGLQAGTPAFGQHALEGVEGVGLDRQGPFPRQVVLPEEQIVVRRRPPDFE